MEIWFFLLGTIFGSVANAVIDRLPKRISWVNGRSKCDKCKHELGFFDLVPVASFLSLGGKCRYCRATIPVRNLFVELWMGMGFVFLSSDLSGGGLLLMGIFWLTTVIGIIDWETKLVGEALVVAWGVLVILYQLTSGQLVNLFNGSLVGVIVGVGLIGGIWALSKGKAMGFGDVEIAVVMGWWLGWPKIVVGLWIAFIVGAVVGVAKMLKGSAKLKSEIAFGPFLLLGSWIGFFWGDKILTWVFQY